MKFQVVRLTFFCFSQSQAIKATAAFLKAISNAVILVLATYTALQVPAQLLLCFGDLFNLPANFNVPPFPFILIKSFKINCLAIKSCLDSRLEKPSLLSYNTGVA